MDSQRRNIVSLPLAHLWTDAGLLKAERVRYLSPDDLQLQMLMQPVPLVVAECGKSLRWIENSDYWRFWRQEVVPHLAAQQSLAECNFPKDYCYVASEWSTVGEGPVILLELHRKGDISHLNSSTGDLNQDKKTNDKKYEFSNLDREFYLGLYRYAVQQYQPIIEERTGIRLGYIQVKNISELHRDFREYAERWAARGWFGFLRKIILRHKIREWADNAIGAMQPTSSACYYHQSIYVAFTMGMQLYEEYVIPNTIHELAHRLWEQLGGPNVNNILWRRDRSYWKLKMLGEGYAEYAARIWFIDSYPTWLRMKLSSERLDESNVYTKGLRLVEKLVSKYDPQILLSIPSEWRNIIAVNNCLFVEKY